MPDPNPARLPKYRHYKPKDLAVVRLDGRDVYLGRHGSPESHERYRRAVAEWLARGAPEPPGPPGAGRPADASVNEIFVAYLAEGAAHYRRPSGETTPELANIRDALRPLRRLYGMTPAREFGPLALRAVRDEMVRSGLARTTVNARVNRVRRAFRWAASVELVPSSVVQALATVAGLQRGRTAAREPDPIGPVSLERVDATLPHLARPVACMVRLQLLTAMRPGEAMSMRGRDLVAGDPLWEYRPANHKGSWRGRPRVIPLGPRALAIVREFLKDDPDAHLFDPRDAVAEHHAARSARRESKRTPSERSRRCKARPGVARCERYDRRTYQQAIARACERAFPHPTLSGVPRSKLTADQRDELRAWRKANRWSPLRLRHTAATEIRARYGLEAAQTVLGHARADVTQVYAERDLEKARAVMGEAG